MVVMLLFSGVLMAQTEADYLRSIEVEASGSSVDSETARSASEKSGKDTTRLFERESGQAQGGARVDLTAGLTRPQFEQVLKNSYIGSYLFYKRLSEAQKARVYQFYQTNPDPVHVRNQILQASKR